MTIDLLNTEAFGNMAFEQLHKTYVTLREQRSKALDKLRSEAIDKVSAELMKENHWWQVRTHEGVFLGFGYGDAETVANHFVCKDYKDYYDMMYVKLIEKGQVPKQFCTEKKYKVGLKMEYDWKLEAFINLDKQLQNKGLTLPEIK
jgi:hypothetical protein